MESSARRQPSDDLVELQAQLRRELSRLEEGGLEESELFRAYVQHAQVLAWRGVADGHMDAPKAALECLRAAQPFIDRQLPDLAPAAMAATEIHILLQSLSLAAEALAKRRAEDRVSADRSATDRTILQVLAASRGTFLRRGEIHERLNPEDRPTAPRVGQILVELHEEGVVLRIHGRAQGNPNAAFYALSPRGVELCRDLGLIMESADREPVPAAPAPGLLDQAMSTLVDPAVPASVRSILAGLIGNLSPNPEIRNRLQYWISRSQADESSYKLIATIYSWWGRQASSTDNPQNSPDEENILIKLAAAVETCEAWRIAA